jgi:lipoyltransferase/lipoate-protein ligase
MKYVNYPFNEIKRLSFYLSTEEYLALHYPAGEYFFMWQVEPSVIFGRNQLIENEVNLDYVRENGIRMYRRKSGGGCVYSDFSNIMFSFVTPDFNQEFVFDKYLGKVVDILKGLGLNACFSGRNDILVDGMKVSGNAFYKVVDKAVVHGTMLFNTDLSVLVKAITPSNEKLISKGIDSVRKRVRNLSELLTIDIEEFKRVMRTKLCDEEMTLTPSDIQGIEEIEKGYLSDEFIYGKNPRFTVIRKGYIKAGYLEIDFEIKNGTVMRSNMLGDYFLIGEQDSLLQKLAHVPFTKEAFQAALSGIDLSQIILHLDLDDFLKIIF